MATATIRIHPNNLGALPGNHKSWEDFIWESNLICIGNKGTVNFDNPTPWDLVITFGENADRVRKDGKTFREGEDFVVKSEDQDEVEVFLKPLDWSIKVNGDLKLAPPNSPGKPVGSMQLGSAGRSSPPRTGRPIIIISRTGSGLSSLLWAFLSLLLAVLFGGLLRKSRR